MQRFFPEFDQIVADGRFQIVSGQTNLTVFTARSQQRDINQLQNALAQVPDDKIGILVAPYHEGLAKIFQTQRLFYYLAPVAFSQPKTNDRRLLKDATDLDRWINDVTEDDKFSIYIAPQWQTMHDKIASGVQNLLETAAVRLKTIRHFARLWHNNAAANEARAVRFENIAKLAATAPDVLVMAGPSLDETVKEISKTAIIWCADTALPCLLAHGKIPRVVFSVDAGFASREHFVGAIAAIQTYGISLVTDLLANSEIQRLPFATTYSYSSSNPLVENFVEKHKASWIYLSNPAGDVGSLMQAAHEALFGTDAPRVLGHDRRHRNFVTHARGTAYFRRTFTKQTRLHNSETYMHALSRRYR
jgi:hypothetical protein